MEEVATFKYLGRHLDQTYDDWPVIRRNIKRVKKVWGVLGKFLIRKGADPSVVEMFYRVVINVVILFGLYTGLLSAEM